MHRAWHGSAEERHLPENQETSALSNLGERLAVADFGGASSSAAGRLDP